MPPLNVVNRPPPSPESISSKGSMSNRPRTDSFSTLESNLQKCKQKYGPRHAAVAASWNRIGAYHFEHGHEESARQAFQKAIECDPSEHLPVSYYNLGIVYGSLGIYAKAVFVLEQALEAYQLVPTEPLQLAKIHHQLGLTYTLAENYVKAHSSFQMAKQLRHGNAPATARTLDAIGKVYLLQGDREAAYSCHEQAFQVLPSTTSLVHKATIHWAQHEYAKVLEILHEAHRLQPSRGLLSQMAAAYDKLDMPEAANQCRQQIPMYAH